jgi:hypothetical protein
MIWKCHRFITFIPGNWRLFNPFSYTMTLENGMYVFCKGGKQMGKEDEVRLIAYKLWEEEGCTIGQDCEYWYKAEIIWEQNQKTLVSEQTESKQVIKQAIKTQVKQNQVSKSNSKPVKR